MLGRFQKIESTDPVRLKHLQEFAPLVGCAIQLAQLALLFSLIFPGCWLAQPFGSIWNMVNEAGLRVPTGGIVLVVAVAYAANHRVRAWCSRMLSRRSFRIAISIVPGMALLLVMLLHLPVFAALYLMLLMVAFLPSALMLAAWLRDATPFTRCSTGCLALLCTGLLAIMPTRMTCWFVLGMAGILALCLHFDGGEAFKPKAARGRRKSVRRTGYMGLILAVSLLFFGVMLAYCAGARDAAAESYSTWLPWRSDDYLSLWSSAVGLMFAGVALMRPGGGGARDRLLLVAPTALLLVFVILVRVALPGALPALAPSLFVLVVLAIIGLLRDEIMQNAAAGDSFVKACALGAVVGMADGVLPDWLSISQSDSAMPVFMLFTGATLIVITTLLWGERVARRLVRRRQVVRITAVAALSHREFAVVAGMLAGESLGSLADRLGISRPTVSTYAKRAYHKLGVSDQAELIERAQERPAYGPCVNPKGFSVGWQSTAFPFGSVGAYLCGFGLHELFAYELFKPHILAWIAGLPMLKMLLTPGAAACALVAFGALACGWALHGARLLSGRLLLALIVCGAVGWVTGETVFDGLLVHVESGLWHALGGVTLVMGCTFVLLQFVRDGGAMRVLSGDEDEARAALVSAAGLTASEAPIALMLARGMCPSAIAEQLVVSPRTVEAHRKRIYAKLGIHCQDEVAPALWSRVSRQPKGTGDIGWRLVGL